MPSLEICGEAANGREAIEKTIELRPEVVLMDVGMPELDAEVLIFTQYDSGHAMHGAVEAGARGYLAKSNVTYLVTAIETGGQHKRYPRDSSLAAENGR